MAYPRTSSRSSPVVCSPRVVAVVSVVMVVPPVVVFGWASRPPRRHMEAPSGRQRCRLDYRIGPAGAFFRRLSGGGGGHRTRRVTFPGRGAFSPTRAGRARQWGLG